MATVVAPDATDARFKGVLGDLADLLSELIAEGSETDPAVRAVFGIYFSQLLYLDAQWVEEHLDTLMPVPQADPGRDAPWDAYMEFSAPPSRRVYDILATRYGAAVALLADGVSDQDRAFSLGMHTLVAHAFGWDGEGTHVRRFFALAPPETMRRVVEKTGSDLMDRDNQFSATLIGRLEALWRERLATSTELSELAGFGLWFASGRFEPEHSLELLDLTLEATRGRIDSEHEVGARLRELAPDNPRRALVLFHRMLSGLEQPWNAMRLEADGLALVRLGLARRVRDRFGHLGYTSFRDLA